MRNGELHLYIIKYIHTKETGKKSIEIQIQFCIKDVKMVSNSGNGTLLWISDFSNFIHHPVFYTTQEFRKLIFSHPHVRGWADP
jgi:hypothetical protein